MSAALEISCIGVDGGTQPRALLDPHTVVDYAQAMVDGAIFPPVTVYYDGERYWLADGYHRIKAARRIGRTAIEANVTQGTRRDAILHSVGANATHGLRRTNADKRRAVETLLRDDEWSKWSDSEIGRRCAVHHSTVARIRSDLSPAKSASEPTEPRTYTTKHGAKATMRTENIGRRAESEPEPVRVGSTVKASGDAKRRQPSWADLGDSSGETMRDDGPADTMGQDTWSDPNATDVDYQSRILKRVVDQSLEEIPDATVRHEVVNNLLKYLRELSVRFNREGAAV